MPSTTTVIASYEDERLLNEANRMLLPNIHVWYALCIKGLFRLSLAASSTVSHQPTYHLPAIEYLLHFFVGFQSNVFLELFTPNLRPPLYRLLPLGHVSYPSSPSSQPKTTSTHWQSPQQSSCAARSQSPKPLYQQFLEIGKECNSDIIHIDVLGDHTVVLNSVKTVTELLDHRNSNYSDRPVMHMVDDLMGWEWDFAHMGYSDRWRPVHVKRHRKTFQHYFQPQAITEYHPFQRKAVTELLHKLFTTPQPEPLELEGWIRHHAGSIILRATYIS
ncbi:hypothetical protein VKT23_019794 [Stygiomarasmius scandens]|uniref:Uncharacterized protein n=1 Tax=Marasmiellus scandens TaxID=2682957 RepID=A0ABR1IPP7_9AGAR